MSLKSSIIYFMFGNHYKHKEIGIYINESNKDKYTSTELNDIISMSKNLFEKIDEGNAKNKRSKEVFQNYNIYYTLTNTDIFYLSAVLKDFESKGEEDDIFQLFEDIEYQGIRKLTDKNGELSKIGKQNLKFCIEKSGGHNIKKNSSILDFFRTNNDGEQNTNTISLLSTQINDIQNDVKDGMKKLLNNVDEMGNLDKKSEKIKDSSINFKNDTAYLQRRMRCRRISILVCLISVIVLIIILIIIFK